MLVATLQRLAEQDPLTGIANRQGFQALLTARLAENEGRGVALGHLDWTTSATSTMPWAIRAATASSCKWWRG